jgi:hypothetical protein
MQNGLPQILTFHSLPLTPALMLHYQIGPELVSTRWNVDVYEHWLPIRLCGTIWACAAAKRSIRNDPIGTW